MAEEAAELARAFLGAADATHGDALPDEAAIGKLLHETIRQARALVPGISTPALEFCAHLGALAPAQSDLVRALEQRALADAYLAYACSRNDEAAVRWFVETFVPDIERIVAKAGLVDAAAADATQTLLVKLAAPSKSGPSKLASYCGQGPLRAFVRVAASRMVIDLHRRRAATPPPLDLPHDDFVDAMADADVLLLRARYRDEVREAFEHALQTLDPKDKRLLHNHLLHRLSSEELGALFGVHRTTAARWCEQARHRLIAAAKARLTERLGLGAATVDSIVALVRSDLELSVQRLLTQDHAPEPE